MAGFNLQHRSMATSTAFTLDTAMACVRSCEGSSRVASNGVSLLSHLSTNSSIAFNRSAASCSGNQFEMISKERLARHYLRADLI